MKFIVAVDLEGVACAYAPLGASVEDSFNVQFVRKQATKEADAAVRALFDMGATEVVVWDNHGRGCSLDYDLLDERCHIAIGADAITRYPVLDETFSGVILIGYHAKASEGEGAIAHTFSSANYQSIKINGKEFGEIGIDAAIAGDKNVPVIFVSGDDKAVKEAKEFLPWVKTVETKKATAYTRVISKHPKAVIKEIYETVKNAVNEINNMKTFTVPSPVTAEIRYRRCDLASNKRLIDLNGDNFEFVDGYTRKGQLKNIEEIVFRL